MTHKVSELEGALLDAAVAMAEGLRFRINGYCFANPGCDPDEPQDLMCSYTPSTYWEDGGRIIERERICIIARDHSYPPDHWPYEWLATVYKPDPEPDNEDLEIEQGGPTPLIAAMRAYVASKLGDEVELP